MTGQEVYEVWRAAVPDFVCNVPGGPWDELSKAVQAGFDAIAAQPEPELSAAMAESRRYRGALRLVALSVRHDSSQARILARIARNALDEAGNGQGQVTVRVLTDVEPAAGRACACGHQDYEHSNLENGECLADGGCECGRLTVLRWCACGHLESAHGPAAPRRCSFVACGCRGYRPEAGLAVIAPQPNVPIDTVQQLQPEPGLREAAAELVADWREGSEYRLTDTGDEITEGIAVSGCADSLSALLDQYPESQPESGLRAERDRFWNALFYIAHRAPGYVPHAGPECVQVAKDAIEGAEPPAPEMGDDL